MAQITVDADALADMGKQLDVVKYHLDRVDRTDHDASEFVVNSQVAQALHDFSFNWSDKRQQLSHMIGFAAASAIKAAHTFTSNDKEAAQQQQQQQEQAKEAQQQLGATGATTTALKQASTTGDQSTTDQSTTDQNATGQDTAYTGADSGSAGTDTSGTDTSGTSGYYDPGAGTGSAGDTGSTGDTGSSGDTSGTASTGDTGSTGGGNDTGSSDSSTNDQNYTADGTLSDGGTVGLSAEATAGAPTPDHGGGSAVTHSAEMVAPVGLLGAAGAVAWASQRKKDEEKRREDEEGEV